MLRIVEKASSSLYLASYPYHLFLLFIQHTSQQSCLWTGLMEFVHKYSLAYFCTNTWLLSRSFCSTLCLQCAVLYQFWLRGKSLNWKSVTELRASVASCLAFYSLSKCQHTLIAKESWKECEKKTEKFARSTPYWLWVPRHRGPGAQLDNLCAVEKSDPTLMT